MKYRKKPVEIEAIQFLGYEYNEIGDFYYPKFSEMNNPWIQKAFDNNLFIEKDNKLFINTSEGVMEVGKNDFIIKEPFDKERFIYPCKPDIFEATYDKVNKILCIKDRKKECNSCHECDVQILNPIY